MISYLNDNNNKLSINQRCFKCRKDIDSEIEEYYVFINKNRTDNEPFCPKCYEQDIEDMKELDPFITPLYQKNFIRMNKDNE